ncbi:MAG: hypothetical protein KF757_09230 [Phycisphaeraceae bacterium]|jgi:hypothetical protein|nr:hypothetical protein [Phycisphaeraceae bacterium]
MNAPDADSMKHRSHATSSEDVVDRLSAAVSLTVLEIDADAQRLVPAFLLANLMSPALWAWREEKRAHAPDHKLRSTKSRLDALQRFFHHYTFTIMPEQPGGDVWGLMDFEEEERRFSPGFVASIRAEYDATFRKLLAENPESQFGQIVNQPYYRHGLFPRLKNETLEVMNAMATVNPQGKPSGKCIGLGMLWAAAAAVWGRIPLDRIIITGNRAHMFVYLDIDDGHLLNNTKWFSSTRINNQSDLSEFAKTVASGTDTTFFYNPEMGMCHCTSKTSQIPRERVTEIYQQIGGFVSNRLKHPTPEHIRFVDPNDPIPDPAEHETAESYQAEVANLSQEKPGSIYEYALYAFRSLKVAHPQAYVRAALREARARELGRDVNDLSSVLAIVSSIEGNESIFASRERIAMPDETLLFSRGSDRDRALLLFALLANSPIKDPRSCIGLSPDRSFVRYRGSWIDVGTMTIAETEPAGLSLVFDRHGSEWAP